MRTLSGLFQRPYYYPEEELLLKKSKKLLSILLSLALIFCILPATAFALDENETDIISVPHIERVTPTTIKASAKDGVQYRLGTNGTWTSDNVFSGLYPNTTYAVYYRYGTSGDGALVENVTTSASQSHVDSDFIDSAAPYQMDYKGFAVSLQLESDLTLRYYLKTSKVDDEGFSNIRIYTERQFYDKGSDSYVWKSKVIYPQSGTVQYNGAKRYLFLYSGLASCDMCDEVNVTLYAEKNGKTYIAPIVSGSFAEYASTGFSNNNASMNQLLADLLNYGTASQTYFNYHTSKLASSYLGDFSSAATTTMPSLSPCNEITATVSNPLAEFTRYTLSLDNKVAMNIYVDLDPSVSASNVRLKVTYRSVFGNDVTNTYSLVNNSYFSINKMSPVEFERPFTFTVYNGDTAISETVKYSFAHRCRSGINNSGGDDNLKNLLIALMRYSQSATAYFVH